ncbi:cupredoxin domain-containing protein [uncultured Polaribacter sp.]|uniref:cupredoxin domain-containing protein n=1 Tax=uncultured Polaribacter sp. TaxID=174711 RepID=UPI0026327072|nr:cupredoxin domain-containing protein [uncultured Polaribacter sp.]
MKKVIAILVVVLAFAFQTNAQDNMKKETVKTVALEQTQGEFTQKEIKISEGTYIFKVTNNNAAKEVGLVLIENGKDGKNTENHIKNAYVTQMVKQGKTEASKPVTLKKGTYQYFCPFNKTPQYKLIVE